MSELAPCPVCRSHYMYEMESLLVYLECGYEWKLAEEPAGDEVFIVKDSNEPDPANGDRGLLFISYQTSIENQFEFLNNRWMSNSFAPRSPGGDDILIGQNGNAGEKRTRDGMLFGKDAEVGTVSTHGQWILSVSAG